ncbi:MAG: hypothetical protein E2O95_02495, partial [Acidobacteria bacterium]
MLFAFLGINAIPDILIQFWFNQSLGFRTIFWTNLTMQLGLFVGYGSLLALAVYAPVRTHAHSQTLRTAGRHIALWFGIVGGWVLSGFYQQFLLALNGVPFERVDPVFGIDVGFYVYRLPAWHLCLTGVEAAAMLGIGACLIARCDQLASARVSAPRGLDIRRTIGSFAVPYVNGLVCVLGTVWALQIYLSRYGLLLKDNEPSGVRTGAEYLDVVGLFSTLNGIYVLCGVTVGLTLVVVSALSRLHAGYTEDGRDSPREAGTMPAAEPSALQLSLKRRAYVGAALLGVQLFFFLAVIIRDYVFVQPNEPYVEQEYIGRHIEATLDAYRLGDVEVHEWILPDDPVTQQELLASQTAQNAPVVAPWVSYLEEPPDIQHLDRIAVSDSTMVFGPVLQIYQQRQKLRPYYDFLSVDG